MVTLTRVFLYARCMGPALVASGSAGCSDLSSSPVSTAAAVTVTAFSSAFLDVLVGGALIWQLSLDGLVGLLLPAVLPKWGKRCINHLDPPPGCEVINSDGLVSGGIAVSSRTMMDEWSCCLGGCAGI